VKSLVRYLPEGIVLDLSEPDYGHERGLEIVAEQLGKSHRATPVFVCVKHESPMFLQRRPIRRGRPETRIWACHFDGTDCTPVTGGMSDEHRRQTDYVVRAAETAGLRTATEVRLAEGSIRPDAVLYGSSSVAVEVQRSGLTSGTAVARTRKAIAAGMSTSLWFSDRQGAPAWFFRVPSVGMNPQMEWSSLPPARSATVTTGLRVITAARCRVPDFSRCPKSWRAPCGAWHAKHEPWLGMTVDDVAAMAPEGGVVPVRFVGNGDPILLVSPESRRAYEDVVKRPAVLTLREQAEQPVSPGGERVECVSPTVVGWRGRSAPAPKLPTAEGFCRLCGKPSWLSDDAGPVHRCCARAEAAGLRRCSSCSR
jgi:hypothetical protein